MLIGVPKHSELEADYCLVKGNGNFALDGRLNDHLGPASGGTLVKCSSGRCPMVI
jgi:hypothetical protein